MLNSQQFVNAHFPKLASNKMLAKPASMLVKHLTCEQQINQFTTGYRHLEGVDFAEQVLEHFEFRYSVIDSERERIPPRGRVVIIANHPIGSLDALALIKCIREIRSDVKVVANQLLMSIEALHSIILPVDNMNGRTCKQDLLNIGDHLQNDGALLVFPAGEVSRLRPQGVRDTRWSNGFLKWAKRHRAPILPVYVDAKNSALFYAVSMLCKPAATALLVKEMFLQKNKSIALRIGEIIPNTSFSAMSLPVKEQVKLFKKHLYRLAASKGPILATQSAIAPREDRSALTAALKSECECLGSTQDGKKIYLYRYVKSSALMRELGRLREISFRAVGEGTNKRRDLDHYDKHYFHLLLWDPDDLEIAGAYRFGDATQATCASLYSSTLFEYTPSMQPIFSQGLELGRSFVQPQYWGKRSLDYLWQGIGAFLKTRPQYRYLFGPVTLSKALPPPALQLIAAFYLHYFPCAEPVASAKQAFVLSTDIKSTFDGMVYKHGFVALKSMLANMGVSVPTLFKQYSEVCYPDGVHFSAFNIDPDFEFCVDALVVVDLTRLREKKRARYIGS